MKEILMWTVIIGLCVGFLTWGITAIVRDQRIQREKCIQMTNGNNMFCWERYR